jgi:formylmethanofuran dehydrogenase subunit B
MGEEAAPNARTRRETTCPFCGLLCDDVVVETRANGALMVSAKGCALSEKGFARAVPHQAEPSVRGAAASVDAAVRAAAAILREANLPLIGGLATDIAGMRAVLELADSCGAVLDHMNSAAKFRNLLAFQDRGWITATLAEARHRADIFLVVGTDVATRYPRFFERIVAPSTGLFELPADGRELVFLGHEAPPSEAVGRVSWIRCAQAALPDALRTLAALVDDKRLDAKEVSGVDVEELAQLATRIRAARFGVITWIAPDLDFPHAELAVQSIARILNTLNRSTRFTGLPLGGTEADLTADAALLWQVGYPFRTSFAHGGPNYDPYLLNGARLLAEREVDALVWIATLGDRSPPPVTDIPVVLIAPPWNAAGKRCDVYLPVGTPGIDHAGHLVRTDKVVSMRVRQLRKTNLPSVADTVRAILGAL